MVGEGAGLTSVPMLLNTSFNENEPVVCKPHHGGFDALAGVCTM
jgi:predicted NodU family carbamoyl transferase